VAQLSLIPALEAAQPPRSYIKVSRAMTVPHRPTHAQINYLKKLTRIKSDSALFRYVARKVGRASVEKDANPLTRQDFMRAIEAEIAERRSAG
jgi:hypothetical protein